MKILIELLLLAVIINPSKSLAEGGGVGNGGDGIFCSSRAPMAYDYYSSGFLGTGSVSRIDVIHDIYRINKTVGDFFLDKIKGYIDPPLNLRANGLDRESLNLFYKRLKNALKEIGDYTKWSYVSSVPEIRDTLQDDFIPRGCKILQVAKGKDGRVSVARSLFHQLDKRQKEILAFHEALYYVGIKHYGHTTSYFTRSLIRELLRDNQSMILFFQTSKAIREFIDNQLPTHAEGIIDGEPGSGRQNFIRLNIFDLEGSFIISNQASIKKCPERISIKTNRNRSFVIQSLNIKSADIMSASIVSSWFGPRSTELEELSLGKNDRGFEIVLKPTPKDYQSLGLGLNRLDQFYIKYFDKEGTACIYDRE